MRVVPPGRWLIVRQIERYLFMGTYIQRVIWGHRWSKFVRSLVEKGAGNR